MKNFLKTNKWYAAFILVGLAVGIFSPAAAMKEALSILAPITLTALIASLLVAFAGFARNESWQKFVLQYGIVPLFGLYIAVLYKESSITGVVLLFFASAVHFSYWMSSLHSRAYRLKQFQMGFAHELPKTTMLISVLNGNGLAHKADAIIAEILQLKKARLDPLQQDLKGKRFPRLILEAEKEIAAFMGKIEKQEARLQTATN